MNRAVTVQKARPHEQRPLRQQRQQASSAKSSLLAFSINLLYKWLAMLTQVDNFFFGEDAVECRLILQLLLQRLCRSYFFRQPCSHFAPLHDMSAVQPEFAVLRIALPSSRAAKVLLLRSIPLVAWDRDEEVASEALSSGSFLERVVVDTRAGPRTFDVWSSHGFMLVFKAEAPPPIVVAATLTAEGQTASCAFRLLSGTELAEATFALAPADPLLMGHLTMVAYKAVLDAGLVESLYQDVSVQLDGFGLHVPDGVALWTRGAGTRQASLEVSLRRLQRHSLRSLRQLDRHTLPEFVGPNLAYLRQLPPAFRAPLWQAFVGPPGL